MEAAQFDPAAVRKISKALNLKSDSSYRFERGIDSLRVEQALGRTVELIEQIAGGRRDPKLYDIGKTPNRAASKHRPDSSQIAWVKKFPNNETKQILASLGFTLLTTNYKLLTIQVPSWRNDIQIPEDIVEEVGRIIGYGNIAPTIFGNDSIASR